MGISILVFFILLVLILFVMVIRFSLAKVKLMKVLLPNPSKLELLMSVRFVMVNDWLKPEHKELSVYKKYLRSKRLLINSFIVFGVSLILAVIILNVFGDYNASLES